MNRVLKYAWYQLIVVLAAMVYAGISIWIIAIYWRGKEFSILIPLPITSSYLIIFANWLATLLCISSV